MTLQARLELSALQTLQEQKRTTARRVQAAIALPVTHEAVVAALARLEARHLVWRDSRDMWRISEAGEQHLQRLEAEADAQPAQAGPMTPTRQPCMPRRMTLGTGDARQPVLRPGAMDALALPSRIGGQRRWRQ